MRIPPSVKLKALISAADGATRASVENGAGYIVNLANLESLTVEENLVEPKGVATGVIGSTKIFVLAGIVDIAGEKARLEKELAKASKISSRARGSWPTMISATRRPRRSLKRKKAN